MKSNKLSSLILSILFIFTYTTASALEAPLILTERGGVDRMDEPVTQGIPLPKSLNITSTDKLQIISSDGITVVPAQFRVLSRYDGEVHDTSKAVRVVLADFKASIGKGERITYYLKDNGNGIAPAGDNLISEDLTHITINTGRLITKISKENFNLFDEVMIDTDSDGIVNNKIVSSNPGDGIIINYNGIDYTANNKPSEIVIEENGPLKAVLKIKGYYKNIKGELLYPPLGDTGLSYTVRFKAYKDRTYIKVDYSLENENKGWTRYVDQPVHNIFINSVRVKTSLNLNTDKTVQFAGYKDSFTNGNYALIQDHIESQPVVQSESNNFSYVITKNGTNAASGARYEGFSDLRDARKGLMVAVRWFWQNWPKGVEINDNVMNLYLWPDMGYDHRILGGIYKTHELIYNFHAALTPSYLFEREQAALNKRLIAKPAGDWIAKADFLGPIVPASIKSNYTFPAGETLQSALDAYNKSILAKFDKGYIELPQAPETFTSLREKRPIVNTAGPLNWYGWLWFGDTPRGSGTWGYSAQHYSWDYIALMHSLRLDNDLLFEIGEEFVSHAADIIIIHDPYGTETGDNDRLYHGGHRYEQDALMSINDNYSESRYSDVKRSSHFWNRGIVLQYLLTGDNRYLDVAIQTGEHLVYSYINWQKCDQGTCVSLNAATRNYGRAIVSLMDIYKLTGSTRYLDAAYYIFKNALLSREAVRNNPDDKRGYFDYSDVKLVNNNCGNLICDSSTLHESISAEGLIELYYALKDANNQSKADEVKALLFRQADWVKNKLLVNWADGKSGTYSVDMTQYFPYSVHHEWRDGSLWTDPFSTTPYTLYFADTFAFMYKETGDKAWLNLARNLFKDYYFYGTVAKWKPVAKTPLPVSGFDKIPQTAYLKIGQIMKKGLFYLHTEWEESLKVFPPPLPPKIPTSLKIKVR